MHSWHNMDISNASGFLEPLLGKNFWYFVAGQFWELSWKKGGEYIDSENEFQGQQQQRDHFVFRPSHRPTE